MPVERISVVELGLNQIKITIADLEGEGFVPLYNEVQNLHFGLDNGGDCFLKKPQIEEIIKHLKNFKRLCEYYNVQKTYSYAFFMGANKPKNLFSFFDEVFATSGFRFSIPTDEGILFSIYSSAINTLDAPKSVLLEVNTDYVAILQYSRRNILEQKLMGFSPLSLLDKFSISDYESSKERFDAIKDYVKKEIKKLNLAKVEEGEPTFVCAGKPIVDLANMIKKLKKYPLDLVHGYIASQKDADIVADQISQMELDKTKALKGLDGGRADVFCAVLMIEQALAEVIGAEEFIVSGYSMTEGLLFGIANPSTLEKPVSDCLGSSLEVQMNYYDRNDAKHNNQVYELALLLYKQLKVLHKLPRGYVKILRAAAMLHDSGKRVNPIDHAKHSFYVILTSELYGLTHREKLLAAYVASLHEGGEISLASWVSNKDIVTEEDLVAVKKLGIILRLAEYFDASKTNAIVDITCDVLGDSVIMKTVTEGDNSYELQQSAKLGRSFEKFFKKRLEVL